MLGRLFYEVLIIWLGVFILTTMFEVEIMAKICVCIGMASTALVFIVEFIRWCLGSYNSGGVDYEQYKKDNPYWMYPTDKEPGKDKHDK